MPKIAATFDTWVKKRNVDSSKLKPTEKVLIKKGQSLALTEYQIDNYQHIKGALASSFGGLSGDVFCYIPHFQLIIAGIAVSLSAGIGDIVVPKVPYYAQCDSRSDGYRYCFSHAIAMMIGALSEGYNQDAKRLGYSQPENYYIYTLLKEGGDTTNNADHIYTLKKYFKIDAYFSTTVSPADLKLCLSRNIPVPIGVAYKDSGHWIIVKGIRRGEYLINDPYGTRSGISNSYSCLSTDIDRVGEDDLYSADAMDAIFWDQRQNSNRDSGWGVLVTAINGVKTGIPDDL